MKFCRDSIGVEPANINDKLPGLNGKEKLMLLIWISKIREKHKEMHKIEVAQRDIFEEESISINTEKEQRRLPDEVS